MKPIRPLILAASVMFAGHAHAAAITPEDLLGAVQAEAQANFEALSDDLAAAAWMNPSNSAESHSAGIIPVGVQVAGELSLVTIDPNAAHWAAIGTDLDALPLPSLRVSAGVPFGIDVGLMYLSSSDLDLEMVGYEGRFSFGNYIPVPMLEANVRMYSSTLSVGSDLELSNKGFAAMIGANFPVFKPYLEVGTVTSTSTPSGALVAGPVVLTKYESSNSTMALGAKIELASFIINAERASVGDKDVTTIKVGFEF